MTPIERPILFSSAMVRAILDGSKTQTRRIVNPQPIFVHDLQSKRTQKRGQLFIGQDFFPTDDDRKLVFAYAVNEGTTRCLGSVNFCEEFCPHGRVCDRLWVRETFYNDLPEDKNPEHVYYRADGECCEQIPECQCADVGKPKWTPSIHMPRWASRITLEITGVQVQRLNQIRESDALAEGVTIGPIAKWKGASDAAAGRRTAVDEFKTLWNSINGKQAWDANPWVWMISFRKL